MKKKLEAELISIAHRILKLKNRAEVDQLQEETLKLYEKLSVLKFVEDNFADIKPTIGYASAEGKLEEIYGTDEEAGEKKDINEAKTEEPVKTDKKDEKGKAEESVKEDKTEETKADKKPEEKTAKEADTDKSDKEEDKEDKGEPEKDTKKSDEPEQKVEVEKPEEELKTMEESAAAVYEKEQDSTEEEEAGAADAEMITIEPDKDVEVEESDIEFEFAFERKPAPEEPKKEEKKPIGLEDFHDYKEPEFVKKSDFENKPKEEPKAETKEEPKQEPVKETPKAEDKKEEPKDDKTSSSPKSLNDKFAKTITLGLNDRIAFEKHLFGGSSDDLNRVISQLNTIDNYEEAKNFIEDLVKPDYNNWQGKEDYEERFFQLVEKRFA